VKAGRSPLSGGR